MSMREDARETSKENFEQVQYILLAEAQLN